ncbi:hypothetical protein [Pseudofrankia sp. DC12]|uniref:hypothetical protein n=1 Tax=Pseudofrankia sp. DC12 TaxID=683315 RepID=UPI000AB22AD0|nr:hypothetical protein [Pseudofrankia sp. DC12]
MRDNSIRRPMTDAELARDARLCDRQVEVIDASNRAYDLADRAGRHTPTGRRAAALSETLADRHGEVSDEIERLRGSR